jgi:hypothetical protein
MSDKYVWLNDNRMKLPVIFRSNKLPLPTVWRFNVWWTAVCRPVQFVHIAQMFALDVRFFFFLGHCYSKIALAWGLFLFVSMCTSCLSFQTCVISPLTITEICPPPHRPVWVDLTVPLLLVFFVIRLWKRHTCIVYGQPPPSFFAWRKNNCICAIIPFGT